MGLFWYGLEWNREGKLQKQQQQHQNEVSGGKLQAKKNTTILFSMWWFKCDFVRTIRKGKEKKLLKSIFVCLKLISIHLNSPLIQIFKTKS